MTHPAEGPETEDVRELPPPDPRDLARERNLEQCRKVILGPPCHDYAPTEDGNA